MNLQQKKEMLIELGTFVDKNWLDEQFEWCMMRIKKNMVRFGLDFLQLVQQTENIESKK